MRLGTSSTLDRAPQTAVRIDWTSSGPARSRAFNSARRFGDLSLGAPCLVDPFGELPPYRQELGLGGCIPFLPLVTRRLERRSELRLELDVPRVRPASLGRHAVELFPRDSQLGLDRLRPLFGGTDLCASAELLSGG